MKIKQIKQVEYSYGDEQKIMRLLYKSNEPILIKINDFTDQFSVSYFAEHIETSADYKTYHPDGTSSHNTGDFTTVLSEIKQNMPHRIFGQILSRQQSKKIEKHVPLWQKLPLRPKYFNHILKVIYFFGGKGSCSEMHFDREQCCILHLCLGGTKKMLLFTQRYNDNLYKIPFTGDSLIDFSKPLDEIVQQFPRLEKAEGYDVVLEKGDMLFMPRNCWHYTTYHDASSAACYAFYPNKIMQLYGYFTGKFYFSYREFLPKLSAFNQKYAMATGRKKYMFKLFEKTLYVILLPILSIKTILSFMLRPRSLRY